MTFIREEKQTVKNVFRKIICVVLSIVTPVDASKVYGAADPDFDYTVTGMQNGDTEAALKELINATVTRAETAMIRMRFIRNSR